MSISLFTPTILAELHTIVYFLRYGITQANLYQLTYGHGTDNAWDDIWSLIAGSLHLDLDCNPILLHARLTLSEKMMLDKILNQRIIERIPVPYLLKEAHFCDLTFYVDERVLIPRSPIAELILQQFTPWIDENAVHNILDMCTGSGCIAIACCYAFPDALVDAVDISLKALAVAEINRNNHQVADRLSLFISDCWDDIPHKLYDIIIANPPYVSDMEMATLPKEYYHEPDLALRAANNGLAIIEKILVNAVNYLSKNGILVIEVGSSQEELLLAYPHIPFTWLHFEHGGNGVFLLTYEQLQGELKLLTH